MLGPGGDMTDNTENDNNEQSKRKKGGSREEKRGRKKERGVSGRESERWEGLNQWGDWQRVGRRRGEENQGGGGGAPLGRLHQECEDKRRNAGSQPGLQPY